MKKMITLLSATIFLFVSGCAQQRPAASYERGQELSSLEQTEVWEETVVSESVSTETQNMSSSSDESERNEPSVAERNELLAYEPLSVDLEGLSVMEYLSLYATDCFETAYVKLDAVDGLAYVYHRAEDPRYENSYIDSVSIYNQGVNCGRFVVQELYPIPIPAVADWQSELGLEVIMESLGFRGAAKLQEHVTEGDTERYYYAGGKQAYAYGDTEWLVEEGFFDSVEEACAETAEEAVVVYGQADATEGYLLWLNKSLISEETIAALMEAVTFKAGAFDKNKMDITLAHKDGVPTIETTKGDVWSYENRDKIAYHITLGELSYRVPEHTVAIRREEFYYDLYFYMMDGSGGICIGTIYVGDLKEGMEDGTERVEEALFSEEQQKRLADREHTSGLIKQTRKYLRETIITADKSGMIHVERMIFE